MASTAVEKISMDDAQNTGFQRKITFYASGGEFVDGYILGIIGPALASLGHQVSLNTVWSGLVGASALIGILLGGLIFGYVTDLIGRRKLFTLDLLLFIIASALQFFIATPLELFVLRLIMGIAIGADYAIAGALVAEFVNKKLRGPMLGVLIVAWYAGYVVATMVGNALQNAGPDAWRWMFVSSVIPAVIVFIMRTNMPESPRWLAMKGKLEEAQQILHKYLGENVDISEILENDTSGTKYTDIFKGEYGRRIAFVSIFWICQVAPFYAIFSFEPLVLKSLHLAGFAANMSINIFLLIGCLLGVPLINKIGRRQLLITPFAITVVALLVLGIWPNATAAIVILCFALFALFNSASSVLETVYPAELFPTRVRATAIGFGTAMSRVGAAIGVFLLPISMSAWGVGPTMLISAAILLIGTIVSIIMAPETTKLSLKESSSLSV